ncbi:hypothetical protein [Paenibacillus agricola]|uniref:SynChlorMet cassette protein ScmC n=1 Tax=Paenibacillus agricola TaxID=2716264 RepID=A0ABX0IZJ4_9BACL|nr:hypothetical protein [Paenibacillus agricola]NHN29405.1 hypothetical protein [Paenibacillus agricola]
MYSIHTIIGDHSIRFTTWSEQVVNWITGTFYMNQEEGHAREQDTDLLVHIDEQAREPFQSYDVRVVADDDFVCYKRSDYTVRVNRTHTKASIYMFDEFALKHALLNLYSSFVIYHEWGLLLHASSLEEGNQAYAFAGRSGTGKSTVAKLSQPRLVLSDEVTIIRVRKQEITVFNSPFRSEIKSTEERAKRRLGGIFILQPSHQVQRLSLRKPDGILQVLNHLFYWPTDTRESNKILVMSKTIAEQVPIAQLNFQQNDTFWEHIV